MATKPRRVVTRNEELQSIKSQAPLIMWSCKGTSQAETMIISTIMILMFTTLGRCVTYHEGFQPIELHDPLTMWSYEIT